MNSLYEMPCMTCSRTPKCLGYQAYLKPEVLTEELREELRQYGIILSGKGGFIKVKKCIRYKNGYPDNSKERANYAYGGRPRNYY